MLNSFFLLMLLLTPKRRKVSSALMSVEVRFLYGRNRDRDHIERKGGRYGGEQKTWYLLLLRHDRNCLPLIHIPHVRLFPHLARQSFLAWPSAGSCVSFYFYFIFSRTSFNFHLGKCVNSNGGKCYVLLLRRVGVYARM